MNTFRELFTGFLSIAAIAIMVFGAISMTFAEANLTGTIEQPPIGSNLPVIELPGKQNNPAPGTRMPKIITQTPIKCPVPKGWETYKILPGETLAELASARASSIKAIMDGNCLDSPNLVVGAILYLPKPITLITPSQAATMTETALTASPTQRCGAPRGWVRYTVQPSDTLFKLSLTYSVSIPDLQFANCLTSTLIRAGEVLYVPNIPTRQPSLTRTSTPTPLSTLTSTPIPSTTLTPTSLASRTNTVRPSASATSTSTSTSTATATATSTPTSTSTSTSTRTPTSTSTSTLTATSTSTATSTKTATPTPQTSP